MTINHSNIPPSSERAFSPESVHPALHKNKRQGRGFFLTLLILSGMVILFLAALFFKGKEMTIFTFEKFVINKAFVSLLPKEYTLEEAEAIREKVYHFYEAARAGGVGDHALLQVSNRIQTLMADEKITEEEVQGLLTLIEQLRRERGHT